jgi:branched-chain amino acid transport system ATP-binding protein
LSQKESWAFSARSEKSFSSKKRDLDDLEKSGFRKRTIQAGVSIMPLLLKTERLTKAFGALRAIDDVAFSMEHGETRAIIGPNGAGKTTFFNLISGVLKPTFGSVQLEGENIERLSAFEIAKKGILRTFQISSIFPALNLLENVLLGAQSNLVKSLGLYMRQTEKETIERKALESLETVGLAMTESTKTTAGALPHGYKKPLEIGIVLASAPKLLLLDEPTSGLSSEERKSVVALLKRLSQKGLSIIIVEHDMDVVFSLAEKVTVLQFGKVIGEGTPEEIKQDKTVIEAYLGEG